MDNLQLNKSNCIFLLGGHDLEMLEIKNLLIEHDYIFIDKNLSWGAKLSDYKDDISSNLINVCVELAEDITPPSKYLRIDHHNEFVNKLSSIEQIASLLGLKLNRNQTLIAANDKGHIAEMLKICATDDEINEIRKLDRAAQGVSPEMEEQAQKELENPENLEVFNTLAIFRTSLFKFSPISDRLCLKFQNYLIYNLSPNEITFTYYGKGANSDLPKLFTKEVDAKTAYFGGIGNGYFGVNKNSFTADEILKFIEVIKELFMKPHSYHAFLFPFKWEHLFNDLRPFEDKINLSELKRKLELNEKNIVSPCNWVRKPFKVESHIGYNEYNYFYDFVRDVVYDVGDSNLKFAPNDKSIVNHYEYLLPIDSASKNYFEIKCNVGKNDTHHDNKTISGEEGDYTLKTYQLVIRKIFLDIYESGVAILSYHLLNYQYDNPNDILNINQFGRRAFIGGFQLDEYPSKAIKPQNIGLENKVDLAVSIGLKMANGTTHIEKFENNYLKPEIELPVFISKLFPHKSITTNWSLEKDRESYVWIAPCIDDRLFVASWFCGNTKEILDNDKSKNIEDTQFWYKYIYVDKEYGASHQNPELQVKLVSEATYDRWKNYQTLYGISRYSFVMFCNEHAPDYLKAVFETMYLKMAEISLVQRATTLRFSDEVQYISGLENETEIAKQIISLYKYHIRFVNKIDFREVTPQEQGIELYDMMQQAMRIDKQVEYLDKEINELHDYALLLEERRKVIEEEKRNEKLNIITYVGVPISIISLILSIIGFIKDVKVHKVKESESYPIHLEAWTVISEVILLSFLTFLIKKKFENEQVKFRIDKIVVLIILLIFLIVALPFIETFVKNLINN